MADLEDVRRIALSLPETAEEGTGWGVLRGAKSRGFAWIWLERVHPKKARVPCPEVIAIRTPGLDEKAALIALAPDRFFTEPHYNGYPAVLVRLAQIELDELEDLLTEGWRCQASRAQVKAFDAGLPRDRG